MSSRTPDAPAAQPDPVDGRDYYDRYQHLAELLTDAVVIHSGGTILYVNAAALAMFGAGAGQEVAGRSLDDFVGPGTVAAVRQRLHAKYAEGHAAARVEEKLARLDGSILDAEVIATPLPFRGRLATQLLIRDVGPRKSTEEALRRSLAALRKLHDLASDARQSFEARLHALLEFGCVEFELPMGVLTRVANGQLTIMAVEAPPGTLRAGQQWPIQDTYCSVTMQAAEPVAIEHAARSLLAEHPGRRAMGLEAYLAARVTCNGSAYGTLCFASSGPRRAPFSAVDREILKQMAHWVGSELERQETLINLRESEHRFRELANLIPQVIILSDRSQGKVLYVSSAYERIWGRSSQSLLDDPDSWLEAVHPEDRARLRPVIEEGRRTGLYLAEYRVVRPDGPVRWVWDRAVERKHSDGSPYRLASIAEDITDRRKAEEGIMRIQRILLEAEQLGEIGNWEWDMISDRVYWSNQINRLLGLDPATVQPSIDLFWKFVHPEDVEQVAELQARLKRGCEPFSYEHRIVRADGEVRVAAGRAEVQVNAEGHPIRAIGVVQDVTERRHFESERRRLLRNEQRYRSQLQALSHRQAEVQEQERRALARELHDEIGQLLTGLKFMLESAGENGGSAARLEQAKGVLNELMSRVRNLSMNLRPPMLDDFGLLATLLWQIERYQSQTGIQIDFSHTGLEERLPSEVETAAFRIVQEALTNIARHAQVKSARVSLTAQPDRLLLLVEDKGGGFDPQQWDSRVATSSGLTGMRERALLLGGTFAIDSAPGEGTIVRVELPLHTPSVEEKSP